MSTERRLSETVARCADLMAHRSESELEDGDTAMRGGVRSAVAWMAELGLPVATVSEIVSDRVRDILAARNGVAGVESLTGVLAAALDDAGRPAGADGR